MSAKPSILPDPLVMRDGSAVTTPSQWREARRPELLALFESEIYGKTPLGRPENLKFVVREEKPDARSGKATRLRVGVLFEGTETGRQMELLVYLPNHVQSPVPLFVGFNFNGNFTTTDETDLPLPTHYVNGLFLNSSDYRPKEEYRGSNRQSWPYDLILERGYGIATACYGEVEPDMPNQWWHGPRVLAGPPREGEWGAIGGWAWALSRAMDYLQTLPRVDASRVTVFGFSRLGKTALWAGAQDERFAAVISQESGKAGISLCKRGVGEPVAHLSGPILGHWFTSNYKNYADNEASLPVDGHCLAALIAPRPLLILSGSEDAWSDPEGEFWGGVGATPVYQLLGSQGIDDATEWPEPGRFVGGAVGYYLRAGKHDVTLEDWEVALKWADSWLVK